ncbi:hypothetical protein HU200_052216 [Digitaria exilis]|uniref:Expansin-like EG45 domain-containing protein n=1 Tax=Digitaria exilis TaxID=1010633 RepID=A0A835E9K1_9POAL|nr:hypothetical protein HU200_052216 [Digitaria exilis]
MCVSVTGAYTFFLDKVSATPPPLPTSATSSRPRSATSAASPHRPPPPSPPPSPNLSWFQPCPAGGAPVPPRPPPPADLPPPPSLCRPKPSLKAGGHGNPDNPETLTLIPPASTIALAAGDLAADRSPHLPPRSSPERRGGGVTWRGQRREVEEEDVLGRNGPGCRAVRTCNGRTFVALLLLLAASPATVTAVDGGGWEEAHATFYGDETGAETMRVKRAESDLEERETKREKLVGVRPCARSKPAERDHAAAIGLRQLLVSLFNDGKSCSGCYELRCTGTPYCAAAGGSSPVMVTTTAANLCPANYSKPNEKSRTGANPPLRHFDLSKPMFLRLVTDFHVGIIPVEYRHVACVGKRGGSPCSSSTSPAPARSLTWRRRGGIGVRFGKGISFKVTNGDGRSIVFDDVVPPTWAPGQSFEGKHHHLLRRRSFDPVKRQGSCCINADEYTCAYMTQQLT